MWTLGYIDNLETPTHICDVRTLSRIARENSDIKTFIRNANMRSKEEILDQADLHLRYNWSCVDARINNRDIHLDKGVCYERHYVFKWLIGAPDSDNWDKIAIHT